MIKILIRRDADRHIQSYSVNGHAEYAEPGKDIVCAGVSAVTIGTVNAVETLLQIELGTSMDKGTLEVEIPHIADQTTQDKVQLLLESMIVMLDSIQQSYNEYVMIKSN